MSKLDVVVVLAAIAGGTFWIERDHRVVIDAPTAADIASSAAAVCPDNDTVPYNASCLDYLKVAAAAPRLQVTSQAVASPATPAACPDNDKQPSRQSCLEYLKGATEPGMRWRVTETPVPPAPRQ
jgi:hypothetical protein